MIEAVEAELADHDRTPLASMGDGTPLNKMGVQDINEY
jgi:hypothetical protein